MRSFRLISLLSVVVSAVAFASETAPAAPATARSGCDRGSPTCPIEVQMALGTDTITVQGVIAPGRNCCVYALRARAGQVMTWRLAGPPAQTAILYPNRQEKGPGLPAAIRLPQDGVYLFAVAPTVAPDSPSGRFALTFTIR